MPVFRRKTGDDSSPLPPGLRPPAGGKRIRQRGRPGQTGGPATGTGGGEKNICSVCRGDPDAKPPVPPRHLHDFTFRSKWACQCRHPGHGLPKSKRT